MGTFAFSSSLTPRLLLSSPLVHTNKNPGTPLEHHQAGNMPPVRASESIDSQPFPADNYHVAILTSTTLTLALLFFLVFIFVIYLAWQSLSRRHYGNELNHANVSPVIHSPRRNVGKGSWLSRTVSALVVRSALIASHPLRFGITPINHLRLSSVSRCTKETLFHGLERSLLWGRATMGLFRLASDSDGSRPGYIRLLPSILRGLYKQQFLGLLGGSFQQVSGLSINKSAEVRGHAPGVAEPMEATGELDPVDIPENFLSTDEAQLKAGTLPIPLITLSLPSREHLVEDSSAPITLDEDLLSPDGTFRSSKSRDRISARAYDISEATRSALASRLRRRQKLAISFPSPGVLTSPTGVGWPRWF